VNINIGTVFQNVILLTLRTISWKTENLELVQMYKILLTPRFVYTIRSVISAAFFKKHFIAFQFQIRRGHWKPINDFQQIPFDYHWLRGIEKTATDLSQNWWSSARDSTY
jgi:hypothetical protein